MTQKQKEWLFILLTVNVPNWQFKHMIINNNIDIKLDNLDNISDFVAMLMINLLKENKGINYKFVWDKKYEKEISEERQKKVNEENKKISEILKVMKKVANLPAIIRDININFDSKEIEIIRKVVYEKKVLENNEELKRLQQKILVIAMYFAWGVDMINATVAYTCNDNSYYMNPISDTVYPSKAED